MRFDIEDLKITQNPTKRRFEVSLDNQIAVLEYAIAGTNIILSHVEVPPTFTGHGIASKLTKTALNYARDNNLKVQPLCDFVAAYIRKYPEYQAITWGYSGNNKVQ